jgi:ATP-dependent helicase/nuclease subunit B
MNRLTENLSHICRNHLLSEKTLLAPNYRIGYEWVEQVARNGQPAVNLRVATLIRLALEEAEEEVRDRPMVAGLGATLLIGEIWESGDWDPQGYLSNLSPSWRLFESLSSTLRSLRMAGLESGQIEPQDFEVPKKGKEIRGLLRAWEQALAKHGWVDPPAVLKAAREKVRSGSSSGSTERFLIVPEDLNLQHLERQFVESHPTDRLLVLEVDPAWSPPASPEAVSHGTPSGPAVQQTFFDPPALERQEALPFEPACQFHFFRALGEVNEVHEVFRHCLAEGIPLDQVEVLHTDSSTYVPHFFETLLRIADSHLGSDREDLPITFEEGIPVAYSRPGRLLGLWLRWIAEDHPQRLFEEMLREGLIAVPEEEGHPRELAAAFLSVPIGYNLNRYLPTLRSRIAEIQRRFSPTAPSGDEEEDPTPARLSQRGREVRHLEILLGLLEKLIPLSRPVGKKEKPSALLDRVEDLFKTFARRKDRRDNYAYEALEKSFAQMRLFLSDRDTDPAEVVSWLTTLPESVRIQGSRPRPGCLHVAPIATGGHSGRPFTFLLGLEAGRFPGTPPQDPILLDGERSRISPTISTSWNRMAEKIENFWRLIGRLRGTAICGFPSRDLVDDREKFPSPLLLRLYRGTAGQPEATLESFLASLPSPSAFVPQDRSRALEEVDLWVLEGLSQNQSAVYPEELLDRFPNIHQAMLAREARQSEEFTGFEGVLDANLWETHRHRLDPRSPQGPVLSASRIEKLAGCPLSHFFRYLLEIELPERVEIDSTVWLSPLDRGGLLHTVFQRFVQDRIERGESPTFTTHESEILRILEEEVASLLKILPAPSEEVYQTELRDLKQSARIFLIEEEEFHKTSRPVALEFSFGFGEEAVAREGQGRGAPVEIPLSGGRGLRLRGRIDRIDCLGDDRYSLWDYKTGRAARYLDAAKTESGRISQHLLYILAAEVFLKERFSPKAKAVEFGYFFPTEKGEGARIVFTREKLFDSVSTLEHLIELAGEGCFPASTQNNDCGYCDYQGICGDTATLSSQTKEKLNACELTPALQSYCQLRGVDHD